MNSEIKVSFTTMSDHIENISQAVVLLDDQPLSSIDTATTILANGYAQSAYGNAQTLLSSTNTAMTQEVMDITTTLQTYTDVDSNLGQGYYPQYV